MASASLANRYRLHALEVSELPKASIRSLYQRSWFCARTFLVGHSNIDFIVHGVRMRVLCVTSHLLTGDPGFLVATAVLN